MAATVTSPRTPVRLAEVVASLSIATDLGMGQPLEFALQSCMLGLRLGEALGYSDEALREIYFEALLRYIGCNVDTHLLAAVVGDEFALRSDFAQIDNGQASAVLQLMLRYMRQANQGAPPLERIRAMVRGMLTLPQIQASFAGHCEVAQGLATRLGFEPNIIYALGQLYERWDGKGLPNGLKGEQVAPAVLVVTLCQDALIFYRLGGVDAARNVVRERRGTAYAPHIADMFLAQAASLLRGLMEDPAWETVLRLEPGTPRWLTDDECDEAVRALADFVDIKSPATLNHSRHVAELAGRAAQQAGLPGADQVDLRRAGWLHDIGKTGISANILEKPGSLSQREWEAVRLHPYHTERILSHVAGLASASSWAALHHELLDGKGYYRGMPGSALPPAARLLAAANRYCALTESRPYRTAQPAEEAERILMLDVRNGRLDGEAVRCVLAAAGHRVVQQRASVAGLSDREIEVLRLLATGHSTRAIAETLVISPKTADHHIQHIYNKIGVSTRAGATLFAVENGFVS